MITIKQINLLITISLFVNFCFSQTEKKVINGIEFKIVTVSIDENEQTEFIELYRNNKKILTHTLSEFDGDCSSENIELGTYEIKDSNFIFYSYWASGDRMMNNIYPFGFRKQTYSINENGLIRLESSKLYVESYVDEWNEHKGMKYLKIKPKNGSETDLLNDYISKAEKMYSGNFVFEDNKDALENEVRKKIGETIIENTKYWKEVYGENCRM